jgi:hypothetical protein
MNNLGLLWNKPTNNLGYPGTNLPLELKQLKNATLCIMTLSTMALDTVFTVMLNVIYADCLIC